MSQKIDELLRKQRKFPAEWSGRSVYFLETKFVQEGIGNTCVYGIYIHPQTQKWVRTCCDVAWCGRALNSLVLKNIPVL